MSEFKTELIIQQLSVGQIVSLAFSKYAKLFYIWIVYLLAYLIMAVVLQGIRPFVATSLDLDPQQLVSTIGTTPNPEDLNKIYAFYTQLIFVSINEHMLASFFLAFAYFFTLQFLMKEMQSDPQFSKSAVTSVMNPPQQVPETIRTTTLEYCQYS